MGALISLSSNSSLILLVAYFSSSSEPWQYHTTKIITTALGQPASPWVPSPSSLVLFSSLTCSLPSRTPGSMLFKQELQSRLDLCFDASTVYVENGFKFLSLCFTING